MEFQAKNMENEKWSYISKVFSILKGFCANGKYCDVNIDLGNESFKGHRLLLAAVSEYFDLIFNSASTEGDKFITEDEKSVALRDIEPEALKRILQFVYTGEIDITDCNALAVLRTSDFLRLRVPFVKERCIEHIQKMVRKTAVPIPNALEIFEFGCETGKGTLIDLMSEHIYEHLYYFSKHDSKFIEMSFDHLNILLKRKNLFGLDDENVLLNSIIQWAHHSFKDRQHHVDELMEKVDFTKIPTANEYENAVNDYENVVNNYENAIARTHVDDNEDAFFDDCPNFTADERESSLHAYIRYSTVLRRIGVFSCGTSEQDWTPSFEFDSLVEQMRSVTLNNHLYCLTYEYTLPRGIQTFTTFNSICARPMYRLRNPPLTLRKFEMCGMRDDIYVYDQDQSHYSKNVCQNDDTFSTEEISRGIYVYRCKVNKWFPLPAMKKRLYRSGIATSNDLLYLIGGETDNGDITPFAQVLDVRTKIWNLLPNTLKKYTIDDCCAHQEKLYIIGSDRKSVTYLDVFDPCAMKWRTESKLGQKGVQLVSYGNELWIINRFNSDLNIEIYNDLCSPKIRQLSSLGSAVAKVSGHAYCLDAVVF